MSTLRAQLQDLAATFVEQILSAIRAGSIQDLRLDGGPVGSSRSSRADSPKAFASSRAARKALTEHSTRAGKANGRLPRRSADEIAALLNKIVLLVKTHKDGMRAEDIRSKLGMQAKEMPRILKEGVAKKKLSTKGQKRATTYFAK